MQETPVHAVKEIPAFAGMTVFRTTLTDMRYAGIEAIYLKCQFYRTDVWHVL